MTNLTNELASHLQDNLDRAIVKDEVTDTWFTGQDLQHDIAILTTALRAANVGRDDVVFMSLDNSPVYVPINHALWQMGATAHPVAPTTGHAELVNDFEEAQYAAVLLDPDRAKAFKGAPGAAATHITDLRMFPDLVLIRNVNHTAPASQEAPTDTTLGMILNTSGTTGKPKRVGLNHYMMWKAAHNDLESHQMTRDDTVLIVMPMFHINAQEVIMLSTFLSDGRIVVAPKFSARNFWPEVLNNDVTWTSVVPTIVTILLQNENALRAYRPEHKLRFVRCASAMLTVNRHQAFVDNFNVPILEGYGMTEATSQCTLNPIGAVKMGSAGKPYKTDVAIVEGDHFTTAAGVHGQIVIHGDHVITDYLDHKPDEFMDGWLLTGDLGYFDTDGYLWLEGRAKYVINRGGEKVSPTKVENTLYDLDFVRACAVVGVKDAVYGQAVAAAINDGSDDPAVHEQHRQAILNYTAAHLAKFERPTQIYFVDSFPKNPTGKIMRPKLAAQLEALATPSHPGVQ